MKDIVIFYHGGCRDGFTAAWAAHKKFGDEADYFPLIWSSLKTDQIPSVKGKEVYFLDFVPTKEEASRVVSESKSTIIIDHHASKKELTKSIPGSIYDNSHSGAVLAWKYFHPNKKVPNICLYIEDSDLWKWEIPGSMQVVNAIDLKCEFDFDVWESIASDLEDKNKIKEYQEKGLVINQFREKVFSIIIKEQSQLVNFEGYEVYAVNAPRFFRSDLGDVLAKKKPPFGIVWSQTPDEISISLRSIRGQFNLIPIVAKYRGGGHESSVNFRLPLDAKLPWTIIK